MNNDDLEVFAKLIWKRKDELLNSGITQIAQERDRLFMWIMYQIWIQVEREYPHVGRIVLPFVVEVKGEWAVCIKMNRPGPNKTYTYGIEANDEEVIYPWPGVKSKEYVKMIAELVDFISEIEGYEVINRFPKNSRDEITDFQIACDYKKSKK